MKLNFTRFSKLVFSLTAFFGISNLFGQCPPGEVEVTIDVTTDTWGYEAYWELHPVGNSCGSATAVFVGGNPTVGCQGGGVRVAAATDPEHMLVTLPLLKDLGALLMVQTTLFTKLMTGVMVQLFILVLLALATLLLETALLSHLQLLTHLETT